MNESPNHAPASVGQADGLLSCRLSICGLEELPGFAGQGVSHVISILDPDYPDPEVFARLGQDERVLFRFDDVISGGPDRILPAPDHVARILELGERWRAEPPRHLLVHCHAGVSRSTATAVMLMAQHNPGREREAFAVLDSIRRPAWPNSLMVRLADDMLGRNGALIEAMREHHGRVARGFPVLAEQLKAGHRAHEVLNAV